MGHGPLRQFGIVAATRLLVAVVTIAVSSRVCRSDVPVEVTVMDADGRLPLLEDPDDKNTLRSDILVDILDQDGNWVAGQDEMAVVKGWLGIPATRGVGGRKLTLNVPGPGVYRIRAIAGGYVRLREEVHGDLYPRPQKGDRGRDARGPYEIVAFERYAEPTLAASQQAPSWICATTKQYYLQAIGETLTHVSAGESAGQPDHALVIVSFVAAEPWWKDLAMIAVGQIAERALNGVWPGKAVQAKLLRSSGSSVIVAAVDKPDELLSLGTVLEVGKGAFITFAFKGPQGLAAEVALAYAPKIAVDLAGRLAMSEAAESDDFEVSLGKPDSSGQHQIIVANHGVPLEDAWVYEEVVYGTEAATALRDAMTSKRTIPTGGKMCETFKPTGRGKLYLGYSVRPSPAASPDLLVDPRPYPLDDEPGGMLDVVFCIDRSGSMSDDIEIIKAESGPLVQELKNTSKELGVSLRIGWVTYTRPDEPNWISASPLNEDASVTLNTIQSLNTTGGGSGNEDVYAASMYAMNQSVKGQRMSGLDDKNPMGWRHGAAKMCIPIGDEPPSEETFSLDDVKKTSDALDPVHFYPLVLGGRGPAFLDSAARGMQKLADATGGQVVQIGDAQELPKAMTATIKLAIRRHKEEVWRKANPPYLLYGVGGGIGLIVAITLAILLIKGLARPRNVKLSPAPPLDPRLAGRDTGETKPPR